ncbi:hypothetical protein ZHAS_00009486 [Anopheles sinensis]|uniref:Uncharacterized protein n=1 Tax=Anopheles sinensis TaxID=74873 RepID=A0A084VVD0_ANOSI|nr:hypothetical protein ZHAS_00009486 [Anopheles sinensis]
MSETKPPRATNRYKVIFDVELWKQTKAQLQVPRMTFAKTLGRVASATRLTRKILVDGK